jgi:hypothetical protein
MSMDIPEITVTMLGHTRSGKTTFMIGMYHVLLSGFTEYNLYATDPDQDLMLIRQWEKLSEKSILPEPTIDEPKYYDFVFGRGFQPLLSIDWMDYRGGTLLDDTSGADAKPDAVELHARLAKSHGIYVVLDGGLIGNYLASGKAADLDAMRTTRMNSMLRRAVDTRPSGRPLPSFVVLLTKADLIGKRTGRAPSEVLPDAVSAVERLLKPVFDERVTTLICPVRLGRISPDYDQYEISPQWLDKPFIFSLSSYLTEQITADQGVVRQLADRDAEASEQLRTLRESWFGRFRQGRDRELANAAAAASDSYQSGTERLHANTSELARLTDELDDIPIVRNGKLMF